MKEETNIATIMSRLYTPQEMEWLDVNTVSVNAIIYSLPETATVDDVIGKMVKDYGYPTEQSPSLRPRIQRFLDVYALCASADGKRYDPSKYPGLPGKSTRQPIVALKPTPVPQVETIDTDWDAIDHEVAQRTENDLAAAPLTEEDVPPWEWEEKEEDLEEGEEEEDDFEEDDTDF